jgi:caffeoyl-CoA O-methyltransferase
MRIRFIKVLCAVSIFLFYFMPSYSDSDSTIFQIPQIEGVRIDGSMTDWAAQGFRVEILTGPDGQTLPVDDFDVRFRLGWNKEGLFVLAIVMDDIPVESDSLSRLWRNDCIEISIAEDLGLSNMYMLAIAPGADPKYGEPRTRFFDWRDENNRIHKASFETAGRTIERGYVMEAMLPWKNLGLVPHLGLNFGFQFVANDDDGQGPAFRVAWFPAIGPEDSTKMYRLSLSEKASDPVLQRIDRNISEAQYTITVQGAKELDEERISLFSGKKKLVQKKFSGNTGRANAGFSISGQEYGNTWPELSIEVSGEEIMTFDEIPKLEFILERYIQAAGGQEAFQRLNSRSVEGRYVVNNQRALEFEAIAMIPGKWTMSLHNAGMVERNGYDGNVGWIQTADRIQRDDHLALSILGWWLNPRGPVELRKYFPDMTLKRKRTEAENTAYVIESDGADAKRHTLEFDAETGLLTRIDNRWSFKDYHGVDGIRLPHQVIINREGGTNIFELSDLKHNVEVDERVFAVPKAEKVFAEAFEGLDDSKVLPMLKMEDLTYHHGEMNIPCRDGRFLYDLILQNGYKRGLEIGTYNGYSTLWFGLAFKKTGGKVFTIEIEPGPAYEARRNFTKAGLDDVIDSRINDAFEEIEKIEGKFDFIFIDANKKDYGKFFEILRERIIPGGALVAHNVANYARDMKDFLDAIQSDPDFETTFHPISAEGLSVSIKRRHE